MVWFVRRDRWLDTEMSQVGSLSCAVCCRMRTRQELELHHVSYDGVRFARGLWQADEAHADLMAMDPRCHELLHRLIDRDRVLRRHRGRNAATKRAIAALQHAIGQQPKGVSQ